MNHGFFQPTRKQKRQLLIAFAEIGKPLYGKTYDLLKSKKNSVYDDETVFDSSSIDDLIFYELKSTSNKRVGKEFEKHFFGLSAAEVLLSQTLGDKYRFILYNILTDDMMELTRQELFAKAKKIYPTWSIEF